MIPKNVTRFLASKKINCTTFELPAVKLGALESARLLVCNRLVFKKHCMARIERGSPSGVIHGDREWT